MSLADLPISARDRAADDMALLRQYVDEDSQDAFAALLDRHAAWIHASARRALRTRDLADDATQTVFVILARKAPSIAPNVRVSGWLYHTTRFVISDLRKRAMRHRRRHDLILRAALERQTNGGPRAGRRLDHVRDTINEALARLPEHERDAISMHFFDGMTFRQMGEVLGLSREGAKKRVARAMARLRAGFAIKGAAVAALATVGAAIRALLAPTAVKAAITTIGNPAVSVGKLAKLLTGGAKLLVNEIGANAVRITAVRVATAGAVVGTAVFCGSKVQQTNHDAQPGRQIAMQMPTNAGDSSRTPHLSMPATSGAVANADKIRNAEAPQVALRQLAGVAAPTAEVRGTNISPRTISPGNAVAAAQFEDPFERPAVYAKPSADPSQRASTRVDDFRPANGGVKSNAEKVATGEVRKPLELQPLVDPKTPDSPVADAKTKPALPEEANNGKPAGEVDRRVRRASSDNAVATNSTPPKKFDTLAIHQNGSGGRDHAVVAVPDVPPKNDGGSRPTLGIPKPSTPTIEPANEQPNEVEEPADEVKPDEETPAPPPTPQVPEVPVETPDNEQIPVENPVGGTSGGDDGTFVPAPPVKPLPGGHVYDLLDHDAPSPTPVTDEMPPASDDIPVMDVPITHGAEFSPPVMSDGESAPALVPTMQLLGTTPSEPVPSMQLLPEPSAGLVALIAGVMGLSRRQRRRVLNRLPLNPFASVELPHAEDSRRSA